jgi:hypothetical protein
MGRYNLKTADGHIRHKKDVEKQGAERGKKLTKGVTYFTNIDAVVKSRHTREGRHPR